MAHRCFLCDQKRDKFNNILLHSFPKDAVSCKKWVEACGLNPNDNLKNVRICSNHFQLNDFMAGSSRSIDRLKKDVFPSIDVFISKRNVRSSCEETSEHLQSDNAEEGSAIFKERRFREPGLISEIRIPDVATPDDASRAIALAKRSIEEKNKIIKNLREKRRYLKSRVTCLEELVNNLRERKLTHATTIHYLAKPAHAQNIHSNSFSK